jgi:hypothetical protein
MTPLIVQRLGASSKLPLEEFRRQLKEFKALMGVAADAQASIPPATLAEIEKRMRAVQTDTPVYWQAAAAFVTYKSAVTGVSIRELPACLNKEPVIRLAKAIDAKQTTIELTKAVYEDCEFVIDSPVAAAVRQKFLNFTGLELRRVRVVYQGGEVLFPSGSAGVATFIDCSFVLSLPGEPSKTGRGLIQTLLAATNLSNVEMISGSLIQPMGFPMKPQ